MKKLGFLWIVVCLAAFLAACQQGASGPGSYDTSGIVQICYNDIDTVCEDDMLCMEGARILTSMQDSGKLLLSFVVDSSIVIDEELGAYDHLIVVNPAWMERFDALSNLKEITVEETSSEMQAFLKDQLPLWTADGGPFPEDAGLYEYTGDGLLAFLFSVDEIFATEANHPLVILVDHPASSMNAKSFLLPLTSSANLLFTDAGALEEELNGSIVSPYISDITEVSIQSIIPAE